MFVKENPCKKRRHSKTFYEDFSHKDKTFHARDIIDMNEELNYIDVLFTQYQNDFQNFILES